MSFDSFYAVSGSTIGEGAGVRFPGHCFSRVFLGVAQSGKSSTRACRNVPGSNPGIENFPMKIFSQSKDFGKISGTVSKSVRIGMGYAA